MAEKLLSNLQQDASNISPVSKQQYFDSDKLSINNNKRMKSLNDNQLKKIESFMKKYQPLYFTKTQIKQLSYKYKKCVEIVKYKQAYYFGQVIKNHQNDKFFKQGKGIMIYEMFNKTKQNLRIYEGQWKNDQRQGIGFQKFTNGSVYHGYFINGKPQGKGKFTNVNGQVYEGEWKNGLKHGQGHWKGFQGQTYKGQWKLGHPQGYGLFINQIGDRYQGQFKNSVKYGQGIQKFINGDMYKGSYQNGKPNGYGQYYWKNKSYFKGNFKNGLRCGQGLWKRGPGNNDKYQGQYQNDKKWGYGVFTWENGNLYKGNYSADLRNGYGQMYWQNGNSYKGYWKDGVQNGQGEIFVVNEGLRKGIFQNNQLIQILYEKLIQKPRNIETPQNESKQQEISIKRSQKMVKTSSFSSKMSVRSKKSRFTMIKPSIENQKQKTVIKTEIQKSRLSLIESQKNNKIKNQNQIRTVPLTRLFNQIEAPRYFSKINQNLGFRIKNKSTKKSLNDSMNFQNRQRSYSDSKKKNRILHSSFYIHRFKNIGKPIATPKFYQNDPENEIFTQL